MRKINIKIPQAIIIVFLIVLFMAVIYIGLNPITLINESIIKLVMNCVLVLSLIPMINCGIGMNFGLPVGIIAGLIGICIAIQFNVQGYLGFFTAIFLGSLIGVIFGYIYSLILNRCKGKEEIVGVFAGFSFVSLMNIFWTIAPFTNRQMLYPVGGKGLRPKINLENTFGGILDNSLVIHIGQFKIPLGLIIFLIIISLLIHFLFKTKLGHAMKAISENENFARLSGVNVNKTRTIAIIISTAIAAIGICVYSQSYGFIQLYDGPLMMAFPAISAILIGGATRNKATVIHAIVGTFLFQTTYLISVPVANELLIPELSEVLRMIITNGILLYAFLYKGRKKNGKA
ncbi:MAG: ABC transporter permease [Clostridium sp.]|uniref:ABC transporter permease subunit n=1 Tax=Clostridium sp. TaxID=1506 RepID=UPI0030480A6B